MNLGSKNIKLTEDVFYNIQIRESELFYHKIGAILFVLLGADISMAGLVIGILADQIFFQSK